MAPCWNADIMTTISDFLASLNLSQYQSRFLLEGITNITELVSLSDAELEGQLVSYGLLKGHVFKLRHAVEQLRGKSPQKATTPPTPEQPTPSAKPVPCAAQPSTLSEQLLTHTARLTAKLAEIDQLKTALTKSKETILDLDVGKYRLVLDQIEALQRVFSGRDERLPTPEVPQTEIEIDEPSESH